MLEFNNKQIETDKQGYLLDTNDWSEELAPIIAEQENITLSEQHWEVVHFVRDFYLEYNTSPAIRMLVKAMAQKLGEAYHIPRGSSSETSKRQHLRSSRLQSYA